MSTPPKKINPMVHRPILGLKPKTETQDPNPRPNSRSWGLGFGKNEIPQLGKPCFVSVNIVVNFFDYDCKFLCFTHHVSLTVL